MELRQIKYFITICKTLHFGKAAEILHISEQPLSFQIKKLENELGYKLFERTTRMVKITPAGYELLDKSQKALAMLSDGIERGMQISMGNAGIIKLAYNSMTFHTILPPIIRDFKKKYPDTEIVLFEKNSPTLEQSVLDNFVDLGIVALYWKVSEELKYETIFEDEAMIALPKNHPLALKTSLTLSELKAQQFIAYSKKNRRKSYDDFEAACHASGFSPDVIQEAENEMTLLALVASGLGIAVIPGCYKNVLKQEIVYKRLKHPKFKMNISLAWKEDDLSPTAFRFIQYAKEYYSTR